MYRACNFIFQVTQPMSIANCSIAHRGQRSLEGEGGAEERDSAKYQMQDLECFHAAALR